MKKIALLIGFGLVSFVLGFFVSIFFNRGAFLSSVISDNGMPVRQGGYEYINPILYYETGNSQITAKLAPFKHSVEQFVSKKSQEKNIDDVAVYFRNFDNDSWFGINEETKFTPASLLKLPLLIAYYKKAEQDKSFLSQKITYSVDSLEQFIVQNISPTESLVQDETYTIEDLIQKMIIYSDNHAMLALFMHVNKDLYDSVYRDLGIHVPDISVSEDYLSVKEYARFFHVLFNASYLDREFSDRALRLLAQVEFQKGIKAGIPSAIKLAHKFGERSIEGNRTKQFHDCGIVYYPNHPYLLCIMTKGTDIAVQEDMIGEISRLVYQEVDSLHMD